MTYLSKKSSLGTARMWTLTPMSLSIACVSSPSCLEACTPVGITKRTSSVLPPFWRKPPLPCFQPAASSICLALSGLNVPTAPELDLYPACVFTRKWLSIVRAGHGRPVKSALPIASRLIDIAIAWRTSCCCRLGLVPLSVKWRKSGPPATRTTPPLVAAARLYELGSIGRRLTSTSPLTKALTPASPSSARVMMRSSLGFAPHQFGSGTIETVFAVLSIFSTLNGPEVTGILFRWPELKWLAVSWYLAGYSGDHSDIQSANVLLNVATTSRSSLPCLTLVIRS